MIIKYYCEGWSYIDNVENVKWINKRYDDLIEEFHKRVPKEEKEGFNDGKITAEERRKKYIESQLIHEFEYKNFERISDIDFKISDKFIGLNMYYDHNTFNRKGNPPNPYIRCLFYSIGDSRKCVVFTEAGYLLNDNGKTIEVIK